MNDDDTQQSAGSEDPELAEGNWNPAAIEEDDAVDALPVDGEETDEDVKETPPVEEEEEEEY